MGIRSCCLLVILFCSTISLANAQRDSISIDPIWNYWNVESISASGNWLFVYQSFPNDYSKNRGFAVHTDTKIRVEVTGFSQPQFTSNDFLIGTKNKETVEIDLITNIQTSLGLLSQKDWIEESQVLCFINEAKELVLKKYVKKGNRVVWTQKGVSKYVINPSKTTLLYQRKDNTELYFIDLKTLKEKKLTDVPESLAAVTWNIQENAIATSLEENKVLFIDLKSEETKIIELPKSEYRITELKLSFFTNNDFYISYKILNAEKDVVEDYLDIWNGNDRDLKNKVRPRQKGELKGFVYKQSKKQLVELPRSEKQEYLNIGIVNYLLVYEPLELQDYSQAYENVRYRLLNLETMKEEGDLAVASSFENLYNRSPNGKSLLYTNEDVWEVYDFETRKRLSLPHRDTFSRPLWSSDSRVIYYHDSENLLQYDFKTQKTQSITDLEGKNRFSIVNSIRGGNFTYVDVNKPMLFSINQPDNKTLYCSWYKGKLTNIVDETSNRLNTQYLNRGVAEDGKTAVWTEENYNQPHTVKVFRKGKVSTLLEPEVPEELYNWRKQKVIHYKDKFGVDLTGVLWYPKDFNPSKKYPMITWIYERQGAIRSYFEIPSIYSEYGFNRIVLNEQGYFVFQPDTYVSEEGAGLSALECVTKGIENITSLELAIDKTKLGLMGHSFGGYETSFILGNSKLFAAGVSGAGIHDLIKYTYEYNYQLASPNWFRVERPQIDLRDSFGINQTIYYNNSPIHFAQNFTAPVLLWTGMKDINIAWENTRHMYIALKRYQKPVITLFYENEGHSFNNKKEQIDLAYRTLDWFDYYLKGKEGLEWISIGIDYNHY